MKSISLDTRDLCGFPLSPWERLRLRELCRWAKALNERRALPATSGNFSMRTTVARTSAHQKPGAPGFLVSRSGIHKRHLNPRDFIPMALGTGAVPLLSCYPKASDESLLHDFIYARFANAQVIGHCHAPELEGFSLPPRGGAGHRSVARAFADFDIHESGFSGCIVVAGHELLKAWGLPDHLSSLRIPVVANSQNMGTLVQVLTPLCTNETGAFLIANHGIYVWGESVLKAEIKLESLLHLLG